MHQEKDSVGGSKGLPSFEALISALDLQSDSRRVWVKIGDSWGYYHDNKTVEIRGLILKPNMLGNTVPFTLNMHISVADKDEAERLAKNFPAGAIARFDVISPISREKREVLVSPDCLVMGQPLECDYWGLVDSPTTQYSDVDEENVPEIIEITVGLKDGTREKMLAHGSMVYNDILRRDANLGDPLVIQSTARIGVLNEKGQIVDRLVSLGGAKPRLEDFEVSVEAIVQTPDRHTAESWSRGDSDIYGKVSLPKRLEGREVKVFIPDRDMLERIKSQIGQSNFCGAAEALLERDTTRKTQGKNAAKRLDDLLEDLHGLESQTWVPFLQFKGVRYWKNTIFLESDSWTIDWRARPETPKARPFRSPSGLSP